MDGRQGFFFKGWTSGWGGVEWVAFCFTNPEPRGGGVTIFGPPAKAVPLLTPKPDPPSPLRGRKC